MKNRKQLSTLAILLLVLAGCTLQLNSPFRIEGPTLQPVGDLCDNYYWPQVAYPTRWVAGFKVTCVKPDGTSYERWISPHYE